MYSFKDLMIANQRPGQPEQIGYNAKKRKQGIEETSAELDEILGIQQRMKAKATMRRNKSKIKMGQRRAKKRVANMGVLKKRAMRQARMIILKKLLRGKSKSDLSYGARGNYEKLLGKRKAAIQRIAKKLLPKVRGKDRAKMKPKDK
jgi:hypothetical protein